MKHKPLARQLTAQFFRGNLPMVCPRCVRRADGRHAESDRDVAHAAADRRGLRPAGALPLGQLAWITGGFILLCAALMLLKYASEPRFIEKAMRQYKDFAFQKLTEKSISSFRAESTAAYLSALTNDAASIEADDLSQFAFRHYEGRDVLRCAGDDAVVFAFDDGHRRRRDRPAAYRVATDGRAAASRGKSTLLNLLTTPGMAYAGKILLDGTELRTVSPESLYETISCPCPALRASSSRTRWNRRRCAAMTAFSF